MDRELVRSQKLIDDREPLLIRSKMLELGWQQRRLYSADYTFWTINYKRVGIERKEVEKDLQGSLGDRLGNQLYKQLEHYDFNILLLEGSWKNVFSVNYVIKGMQFYQWSVIWNFIRTWQDRGLTIELTTSAGHTIKRISELYAYYQNVVHCGGLKKNTIAGDPRLLALQCGGIGPKLGTALIEKFGSLRDIANANIEDFASVNKMGKVRSMALYNHFNKDGTVVNPLLVDKETGEILE